MLFNEENKNKHTGDINQVSEKNSSIEQSWQYSQVNSKINHM
jgi:hypothetical protein